MDAAEKSLLFKVLDGLSISEKKEKISGEDQPFFLKEPDAYIEKLNKRAKSFSEKNTFSVGDYLIWKDGLKNKRVPLYGQPAIVIKKFDPPLVDDDSSYNEDLDIQLGFITDDDEFLTFNFDSNRFKLSNK